MGVQETTKPGSSLYTSGWNPKGAKKEWERCSMEVESTKQFAPILERFGNGQMQEAVGWFDDDGACRVLVADFDSGRRTVLRLRKRGGFALTVERCPWALTAREEGLI